MSLSIITVVGLNIGLSLLCWWLVIWLWRLRRQISQWAHQINTLEPQVHTALTQTPYQLANQLAALRSLHHQITIIYQQSSRLIVRAQQAQQILRWVQPLVIQRR